MIATLAELWIYPVKSLAGVRVSRAKVEARGLAHDRRFCVIAPDGTFVSQRQLPAMARIRPAIEGGALRLHDGDASIAVELEVDRPARPVRVHDDATEGIDAGDEVAQWLSDALGRSLRLVRMSEAIVRPVDPRYARPHDVVSYADGFPFLLANLASVDDLNTRLPTPIDVRRFRPNLVVGGAPAWAEDGWKTLACGGLRFHSCKPCSRCVMVDVDPDRATAGKGVLAALATFRRDGNRVLFGHNLVHDGTGEIAEGDALHVLA